MKAIKHKNFNSEFPENFDWMNNIDSMKICSIAIRISNTIENDLKTTERNLMPGLRKSLNIIAEITDI